MSAPTEADAVPVEALSAWCETVGLAPHGPLRIEQLAGGSSNLTFRVRDGEHDWVLRRPPLRGALPTAHDVLREHRFQKALAGTPVPVPRMVRACTDPSVLGAPFYLMERLDGEIHGTPDAVRALAPDRARAAGLALVDALAALHGVDPVAIGLSDLIRPEPFLDRQIRRWAGQWERASTVPVPLLDAQFERLRAARPQVAGCRIVHGDYNLANVMYDRADPPKVLAVLDWELSAIGDALADLGALLAYWGQAGRLLSARRGGHLLDANPALPSAADLVARYEDATGAAAGDVRYFELLATVKLAVICAGAWHRLRPEDDEQRAGIVVLVQQLAEACDAIPVTAGRP